MADAHTKFVFDWLREVHSNHKLTGGALRVCFAISQNLNRKTGDAWPSQQTLCCVTGLQKRAVQNGLSQLLGCGHLVIENRHGPGNTNHYRPLIIKAQQSAPSEAEIGAVKCTIDESNRRSFIPEMAQFDTNNRCTKVPTELSEREPSEELSENIYRSNQSKTPKGNCEKESEAFVEFWKACSRKVERKKAFEAFEKALKKTTAAVLIAGMADYAAERRGQDPRFTKHPATWLNGECWTDEAAPPAGNRFAPRESSGRQSAMSIVADRIREAQS